MAALAETSGPRAPTPDQGCCVAATNAAATGAPASETALQLQPPSSRPERRDVPFRDRTRAGTTARAAPGRGGAPGAAARQARDGPPRAPRGGHLETGPSADALRVLRQGELSERRPLPLRPRESGRCTGRVHAERDDGTRFSAETAVRRRHLPLLRARAVSERRELSLFPRRDEGVRTSPSLVRRNLVTAKTVRNGRTTDVRSRCRMCSYGQDP